MGKTAPLDVAPSIGVDRRSSATSIPFFLAHAKIKTQSAADERRSTPIEQLEIGPSASKYRRRVVYIRKILTHTDCNKDKWK
jgi:hypothetical protein